MKPWGRYAVTVVAGLVLGVGGAAWAVKSRTLGSNTRIGAWQTGKDFGTAIDVTKADKVKDKPQVA